jgi:hypothetical protein
MFRQIPWDVWVATAAALGIAAASVLWGHVTPFVAVYIAVCAYVVVSTFWPPDAN